MALTRQGQILTSTQIATMRLNLANPIVAPAAPYNVIASAINGGANLQWSHPQPSVVDTYIVTASPGGASVTVSGQSATLTGLTNGTAYTFTVQAENAGGTGLASASSNSVTPSALPSSILPVTRGLEAWWSARNTPSPPSDGAGMATWADLSGNGYYLTGRGSSGALPTWKASWSNSKPAVQSNGIDARFDTVGSGLVAGLRAPQATIYALYSVAANPDANSQTGGRLLSQEGTGVLTTSNGFAVGIGSTASQANPEVYERASGISASTIVGPTAATLTTPTFITVTKPGALRANGANVSGQTYPINYIAGLNWGVFSQIGGAYNKTMQGYIAELILFSVVHTSAEISAMETYLQGNM